MQQQIDHVSHVCFIYRRENFAAAMAEFSRALGISDWDGPVELPTLGLLQAQSVSAGIEIIAPLQEGTLFDDHLHARGEGFFALTYGVADVRQAAAQAQARGVPPCLDASGNPVFIDAMRINGGAPAHERWKDFLETYQEIPLQPVAGVNLYLGQIAPQRKAAPDQDR